MVNHSTCRILLPPIQRDEETWRNRWLRHWGTPKNDRCLASSTVYVIYIYIYGYGSIPMKIPFLGGWTSINPSYFDVNYRGTRFWHTAIYIYMCVFGINFNRQSVDAFGVGHCLTPNWWAQASPVIRRCDGCNVLRPNWRKKKTRGKSLPQKCHVGPRKRNR